MRFITMYRVGLTVSVGLLGACGGGGGESFDERGVRVTAERTQVLSQASSQFSAITEFVDFTVSDVSGEGFVVVLLHSDTALRFVNFFATGERTARMQLEYRDNRFLAPGTYNDTIEVAVCFDDNCQRQLEGSPIIISSTHTVLDDSQVEGFVTHRLNLRTNDMIWDPVSALIFAGTSAGFTSDAASDASQVQVLNPALGRVESGISGDRGLTQLSRSPVAPYLYSGFAGDSWLTRYTLSNGEPGMPSDFDNLPLGTSQLDGAPLVALHVAASPAEAEAVLVAAASVREAAGVEQLMLLDGYFDRPVRVLFPEPVQPGAVTWSDDGARVFFKSSDAVTESLYVYDVSPDGLTLQNQFRRPAAGEIRGLYFVNGALVDSNGRIIDPDSGRLLGRFQVEGEVMAVAPDPVLGKTFVFHSAIVGSTVFRVTAFDSATLAPISSRLIEDRRTFGGSRLIRWGERGLALSSAEEGAQTLIIESDFVTESIPETTVARRLSWSPSAQSTISQ